MFGSQILDVLIGVTFVFLSLSMVCSGLGELVSVLWEQRQKLLEVAVARLLQVPGFEKDPAKGAKRDEGLLGHLKEHPLILALRKPGSEHLPSYLPSRTFALATADLLRWIKVGAVRAVGGAAPAAAKSEAAQKLSLQELVSELNGRTLTVENAAHQKFVDALGLLAEEAKGDLEAFLSNVERWFNETMDRLSGAYKKWSRYVLMVVGLFVTVVTDADSFDIATRLYRDTALRSAVVAMAEKRVAEPAPPPGAPPAGDATQVVTDKFGQLVERLDQLEPLVGWSRGDVLLFWDWDQWTQQALKQGMTDRSPARSLFLKIAGWCITAFALALGAPFWFDALNKLLGLRTATKPKEEPVTKAAK